LQITTYRKTETNGAQGPGPEFRDFALQCLRLRPAERPGAEALLDHPFVQQAPHYSLKVFCNALLDLQRKTEVPRAPGKGRWAQEVVAIYFVVATAALPRQECLKKKKSGKDPQAVAHKVEKPKPRIFATLKLIFFGNRISRFKNLSGAF
jgi:hypothetical protein